MNRRVYQSFDLHNVSGEEALYALLYGNIKLVPGSETVGFCVWMKGPALRWLRSGRVTLVGRNVSHAVALNTICEQTGLFWRITPYAVEIVD